jgi:hypothetical protein
MIGLYEKLYVMIAVIKINVNYDWNNIYLL